MSDLDYFDRLLGNLDGLPDVQMTSQATVQTVTPLLGNAETFIVQTVRQTDQGDTIFLQSISAQRSMRIVVPPRVSAVIARQRDALTTKTRRKGARQAVATKREAGIPIGNPAALALARQKPRAKRRPKAKRKAR